MADITLKISAALEKRICEALEHHQGATNDEDGKPVKKTKADVEAYLYMKLKQIVTSAEEQKARAAIKVDPVEFS